MTEQSREQSGISEFAKLRGETRIILGQAGIEYNEVMDRDIVDAIRNRVDLAPSQPWDEWVDGWNHIYFREYLIETLQEAGVVIKEPVIEVGHILEGLRTLLLKE